MRKRGARIRHRAACAPGLVAQSIDSAYEVRLRMAVEAFRLGFAEAAHFNDLVDTLDLMQIGIGTYTGQRTDAGAAAVCELALVALQNIRDRHASRGRFGTTGEELKALELLAETSMDYWNRRSGALFATAYRQITAIRKAQIEVIA
jgi:hypothetical protein